ncbi:MAG: 5-formyltetrahydrofolate cyclo-ligase [Dissulfurispiraceae bacterium]|jgi:5-formyltetrahydrofolate cyclo-ligase|nr:5-formyltetrahydrofolate cyclo-ligase [Dissulfurispiraceae bacterium]
MQGKNELRLTMLSMRDNISYQQREQKNKDILNRLSLIADFIEANVLLPYASFRSEVDTWMIMKEWLGRGRRLLLPRVDNRTGSLGIYEVYDIDDLQRSTYGIMEPDPAKSRNADASEADLILVPGAVFDLSCNRIGYGKGYYDRLLKNRISKAAGLAYDEQIVDSLPTEPHDAVLDMIVTDKRVIKNG